jgi:hypothetical protein
VLHSLRTTPQRYAPSAPLWGFHEPRSLYEDNVFFSFASRDHEQGCRAFIEDGARWLGVRVLRY